jgi:hypothetical protein
MLNLEIIKTYLLLELPMELINGANINLHRKMIKNKNKNKNFQR